MTILSTVCTKLLCTNAHLGRRVAATHLKVYIRGFRNGIAILDSDKTLICLRNAIHFIGSLIRKKGRFFFLKTNHFFIYSIMEKMWSCINDSQWKIGAFLTNSYANPKKFRSRKNQIHFGLNQQPDCVVILHPDRKSSVILEADRSLIPIVSLVDSTIPCEFYKRINYPIPANDSILFVYLFCHLITKTVILERKRINKKPRSHFSFCTEKSPAGIIIHSRKVSSWTELGSELLPVVANYLQIYSEGAESVPQPQGGAAQVVQGTPTPAPQEWTTPLVPPSCYSLTGYVEDWVASNPTFMSDVLNYNTVGRSSLVHSSGFPAASGSGPSLNPAGVEVVVEPSIHPAPTGNFQLGPLTNQEEERLKTALNYKKEIATLLKNIAIHNGENFQNETPYDLAEASLNWEDCLCPERLSRIKKSLEFHQQESSFYRQTVRWVTAERRVRRGQQWTEFIEFLREESRP